MDKIEFLAVIKNSVSAIKIDGGGNGGSIIFEAPETSLPKFMQLALCRNQLLKVTVEPVPEDN